MPDDQIHQSESPGSDPWIGLTLAGYVIIRRLGEGGMGVVYLARHQSLDRLAALKFLPAEMATDAAFIELFLREAKAAAKLNHPNIVDVHDAGVVGEKENIYYFIMEYVEGRDLNSILQDLGTIPAPQATEYARQAAGALAYAHKKNIIHRDIKPENLLLTNEGVIKVVDLGLAKWAGEESSMMTQTGDIMGSPIYISPERLRDPHIIDPRSDIYSLGGTLYHMVTGKIPYEGSSPVIMARHLTDRVPDPRDINPDIDEGLAKIIMKMMAKETKDRYQTMDEVEAALKNELANQKYVPEAAAPATRKNSWVVPAVVIVVAAVGGFFAASLFKQPAAKPESNKPPPSEPVKAAPAPVVAPSKPQVEPPKPPVVSKVEPAKPPLTVADFNTDSRLTRLGTTFGSWGSSAPEPFGKALEHIERSGGPDGSGFWKIDFDITIPKSYCGTWMKLNELDATAYDTIAFKARSQGISNLNFIVELKARNGSTQTVGRRVIRGLGSEWQSFEIPLKEFKQLYEMPLKESKLGSTKSISELTIVFDEETTGDRKGSLCLDDIQFIKKR